MVLTAACSGVALKPGATGMNTLWRCARRSITAETRGPPEECRCMSGGPLPPFW